jgi:hypothetical protein
MQFHNLSPAVTGPPAFTGDDTLAKQAQVTAPTPRR